MSTNLSDLLGYQFRGIQGVQGLSNQGTQGLQGETGIQGSTTLGIATEGGTVGTGVTLLDFRGPGISTVTVSSGIATVNITGGSGSGTNPWRVENNTYSASVGDQIVADTSGGSWTIILPMSPSAGDIVRVADGDDWETNPLFIERNGSTIDGYNQDFSLDIKGITVDFIYDGTTWEVFANTGPEAKESLWAKITSDTQAYSRDRFLADASGGSFTIVLPDAGTGRTTGSFVRILDGANWSSIGITIGRNGATIEGQAEDMYLDIGNIEVEFAYDGTTWNVYPSVTASNQVATIEDIYGTQLYPVLVSGVGTGQPAKINTSNFVFDSFNGRLGIGTTTPQYNLDVNGDINFTGTFYQDGSQFVASRWTVGAGTSIYRDSFVGIGTTTPQYNLDVNGDINFEGSFYQNGSLFVASRWTAGAGTSIYRDSFVGIGTTNPQYDLDVDGNINFTGIFYQDGSQFVASRWTAGSGNDIYRLDGNVGIGTTNPSEKLTVDGNISNTRTVYGSISATTSSTSAIGIHSSLSSSTYRSVEYFVQATSGTDYQGIKIISIHDGSLSYNTNYGEVRNNGVVANFDVDISGGNIRLVATATTSSTVDYIVNYTANIL